MRFTLKYRNQFGKIEREKYVLWRMKITLSRLYERWSGQQGANLTEVKNVTTYVDSNLRFTVYNDQVLNPASMFSVQTWMLSGKRGSRGFDYYLFFLLKHGWFLKTGKFYKLWEHGFRTWWWEEKQFWTVPMFSVQT